MTSLDLPAASFEPLAGRSALIVEDDYLLRSFLIVWVERLGCAAIGAGDGEEALRLAEAHPGQIEILVADVMLPGMTGIETANRLRSSHPEVKTIYMSGRPHSMLVDQGFLQAGDPFMQKPFTFDVFKREILRSINEATRCPPPAMPGAAA